STTGDPQWIRAQPPPHLRVEISEPRMTKPCVLVEVLPQQSERRLDRPLRRGIPPRLDHAPPRRVRRGPGHSAVLVHQLLRHPEVVVDVREHRALLLL